MSNAIEVRTRTRKPETGNRKPGRFSFRHMDEVKEHFEQATLSFVRTELELALTFGRVGKSKRNREERVQTFQNVLKAYQAALKASVHLSGEDRQTVEALFETVERELIEIGAVSGKI